MSTNYGKKKKEPKPLKNNNLKIVGEDFAPHIYLLDPRVLRGKYASFEPKSKNISENQYLKDNHLNYIFYYPKKSVKFLVILYLSSIGPL